MNQASMFKEVSCFNTTDMILKIGRESVAHLLISPEKYMYKFTTHRHAKCAIIEVDVIIFNTVFISSLDPFKQYFKQTQNFLHHKTNGHEY